VSYTDPNAETVRKAKWTDSVHPVTYTDSSMAYNKIKLSLDKAYETMEL
jgi:hypothetical protein